MNSIHYCHKSWNTVINRIVAITLLVLAMLVVNGLPVAQAGDAKVYPGSFGVPWYTNSPTKLLYSAIGNPSYTSWLNLDLPIINDDHKGIYRGWVRVIDEHPLYNVACSLNSYTRFGSRWYGFFTPTKYTSGSAPWAQILTFGSLKGDGIFHYYYSVKIPPSYAGKTSYVTSYRVEEQ